MKFRMFSLALIALCICGTALAEAKSCESLKTEIEAKLKEKGVTSYSLEIVPSDQVKDQKVVGSCDGGKNKITYSKETAAKEKAKK